MVRFVQPAPDHRHLTSMYASFIEPSLERIFQMKPVSRKQCGYTQFSSQPPRSPSLGSQTKQYSGEVRLHLENPGLRSGQDCRHQLHDDPLCGDKILQSPRGHPGNGVQRERWECFWLKFRHIQRLEVILYPSIWRISKSDCWSTLNFSWEAVRRRNLANPLKQLCVFVNSMWSNLSFVGSDGSPAVTPAREQIGVAAGLSGKNTKIHSYL